MSEPDTTEFLSHRNSMFRCLICNKDDLPTHKLIEQAMQISQNNKTMPTGS